MRRAKAAAIQEVERIQGRCLEVYLLIHRVFCSFCSFLMLSNISSILVDKKRIILIFETKFSVCIDVMDGMFASWYFYINILYLFLFFAQHKHKQFRELLEHYRFNLLYMFNLSYFTEAILKNRTLTDAKKREQFTILKKQMEMDLMVKSMHVIYANHFCHALN